MSGYMLRKFSSVISADRRLSHETGDIQFVYYHNMYQWRMPGKGIIMDKRV